MGLGRDVGGRRPGGLGVTERRRGERAAARLRHHAQREPLAGTSAAASSISARTGVVPRVPMISALLISAPSQCERSMISWPADPGEEVLVAAREAHHFVREHRADDERHVVLHDRAG